MRKSTCPNCKSDSVKWDVCLNCSYIGTDKKYVKTSLNKKITKIGIVRIINNYINKIEDSEYPYHPEEVSFKLGKEEALRELLRVINKRYK